jgi:hypothetical protein
MSRCSGTAPPAAERAAVSGTSRYSDSCRETPVFLATRFETGGHGVIQLRASDYGIFAGKAQQ